jgi:hypothetical protein
MERFYLHKAKPGSVFKIISIEQKPEGPLAVFENVDTKERFDFRPRADSRIVVKKVLQMMDDKRTNNPVGFTFRVSSTFKPRNNSLEYVSYDPPVRD